MTCPKCGAPRPADAAECPQCGIIYARFEQKQERQRQEAQAQQEQQEARVEALRAAATIDCPLCGKRVSRLAPTCPHCGHPIAGTVAPPPDLEKTSGSKTKRNLYIAAGIFLLYCFIQPLFIGGGDDKAIPASKPSPEAAPGTPSVPRIVSVSQNAFGCHDIDSYWLVVAEAKKGDVQNFARVMNEFANQGKCDMVRVRTATALEFLPAGAVRIRDANNVLWWVSDASVSY